MVSLGPDQYSHTDNSFSWLKSNPRIRALIHLGAVTDTTIQNKDILRRYNIEYPQDLWKWCTENGVQFIYASSAATYGVGESGFSDSPEFLSRLRPLNLYGWSKHQFDLWATDQASEGFSPPHWSGLKFFNVYGPHEDHKGRMASVAYHGYRQAVRENCMRLFKSYRPDFKDGEQKRDFIYVKDVVDVILHFLQKRTQSGIYNVGTGKARSFNELAHAVFRALNKPPRIEFIDMPEDIRSSYQYFTKAEIAKLRRNGYESSFTTLDNGVQEYIHGYLLKQS